MRNNIHIVIGSLILASVLWVGVTMSNRYQQVFKVPLNFRDLPDKRALKNPLPEHVYVKLRGSGWQLLLLKLQKSLRYEISRDQISRDRFLLTNRYLQEALHLPGDIEALEAYPETLVVSYDALTMKRIPLVADYGLQCMEGYGQVGVAVVRPDSVEIRGAASIIRTISEWKTQYTIFRDVSSPIVASVPVSDSLTPLLRVYPTRVRLTVPVQQLADVEFEAIPIEVEGVPERKQILLSPSHVGIFVRGGIERLTQYSSADFRARLEYEALTRDTTRSIIPNIQLPEGLILLRITPERIKYTIRE